MQHDITHCRNRRCPKHQECYRYKAHEELKKLKIEGTFSYYYIGVDNKDVDEAIKRGECNLFWPD